MNKLFRKTAKNMLCLHFLVPLDSEEKNISIVFYFVFYSHDTQIKYCKSCSLTDMHGMQTRPEYLHIDA